MTKVTNVTRSNGVASLVVEKQVVTRQNAVRVWEHPFDPEVYVLEVVSELGLEPTQRTRIQMTGNDLRVLARVLVETVEGDDLRGRVARLQAALGELQGAPMSSALFNRVFAHLEPGDLETVEERHES